MVVDRKGITVKVELDVYSEAELRALGTFANALADARASDMAHKLSDMDNVKGIYLMKAQGAAGPEEALNPVKVPDEPITQQQAEALVADATKPARERGKPSHGAARRTKAEIAEDEAADKADAALRAAGEETGAIVADKNLDDEKGSISDSPEDRVDPDNPEDAAQDAADEAAETAAQKAETGGKLTLDDVRTKIGGYVKLFGMDAAQKDGPTVIAMVIGESTEKGDDGKPRPRKVSDIPDDQAIIQKVIAGVEEMTTKNPFKRDKVA